MSDIDAGAGQTLWRRKVSKEADRDCLGLGERVGNAVGVGLIVFVAFIFLYLQMGDYGFFTDRFGPTAQLLFYGSLLFGIAPTTVRAAIGRRNLGRLLDLFGSVLFIIAGSYLLVVFPFDIPSLIGLLPGSVQPLLGWISNDLVRFLLLLGIAVTAVAAVYDALLYMAVRRELARRASLSL